MYVHSVSLSAPFSVRSVLSDDSEQVASRHRACSTYQIARAAVRAGSRRTIVPAPGPSSGFGLRAGDGASSKTRRNSEARQKERERGGLRSESEPFVRRDCGSTDSLRLVSPVTGKREKKMREGRKRKREKEEQCLC